MIKIRNYFFSFFLVLIFSLLWIHYSVRYHNPANVSKKIFLSNQNKEDPTQSSVKTNKSRERRSSISSRDSYVSSIEEVLISLRKMKITNNVLGKDKKSYSWEHLTNYIKSLTVTPDIKKTYTDMSSQSQKELKALQDGKITHRILFNFLIDKLKPFFAKIKPNLQKLATIGVGEFEIGFKTYKIDVWKTNYGSKDPFSFSVDYFKKTKKAREQLVKLYKYKDTDDILLKILEAKREAFWIDINEMVRKLGSINITKFWKSFSGNFSIKELFNERQSLYFQLSSSAKTELIRLHEGGVTSSGTMLPIYEYELKRTGLDLNKLEAFNENIKGILSELGEIYIYNIDVNNKNYSWSYLVNQNGAREMDIDRRYAAMSLKSQTELKLLYKIGMNHLKLSQLYKSKLNFFLNTIKPILKKLAKLKILKFSFSDSVPINIASLTADLDKTGSELTGDAKVRLLSLYKHNYWANDFSQSELNEIINAQKIKKRLDKVLTNKREVFRQSIQKVIKDLAKVIVNTTSVQNGKSYLFIEMIKDNNIDKQYANMSVSAKREFRILHENEITQTKLLKLYEDTLDSSLEDIKTTLQLFFDFGIIEITIDKKLYSINYLLKKLDVDGSKLTSEAKKQLLQLLANKINKKKLQTAYKTTLDPFLRSIKPALQSFKEVDKTQVIIAGVLTPFSITNLLSVLDKNDWETNPLASKELVALYKYNSNSVKVKEKLQTIYTDLIDSFLSIIEPALQLFADFGIAEITIDKKVYSISDLTNKLDVDGSKLTGKAQKQLLQLLVNKINKEKLIASLNDKLNSLFTVLKPSLEEFLHLRITEIIIEDSSYSIGNLAANLNKKGSKLTGNAKDELFALYKYNNDVYKLQNKFSTKIISAFQTNWDTEKVSTYLLWLPIFDIKKVQLSQNQVFPVAALATAIKNMLTAEKFDFTKLEGKAREELFSLLNAKSQIKEAKTFQDDVWRQIKNHSKWKAVEGPLGQSVLQSIRNLLFKVQELGINQVSHPFFPEGYDLNFFQDNSDWKTISFKNLLAGMTVKINETNVEFYSHLFPNKVVFQVPMKKLDTIFSNITIVNIIKTLEKAISDYSQQEKKLESKNKGLIVGLVVGGGVLFLSFLGGFLYWFLKVKK